MRANRKVAHHALNWLLRPTGRAEEPGLEHCPQVVAHGPMLERTSVVGEAEQVDVAHREGLLGWRGPRGYAHSCVPRMVTWAAAMSPSTRIWWNSHPI
jgi:hypothetical protein